MSNHDAGVPLPTNDVVFPALTASIERKRCIAVIGAGMSADDYPIWTDLISKLQERCGVRSEDLSSRDPRDIAQTAKDKNPDAYSQALDDIFVRKPTPRSAARYHLLARVGFISYLSLNVDPVLDPKQAHNQMANGRFPAIKLEA